MPPTSNVCSRLLINAVLGAPPHWVYTTYSDVDSFGIKTVLQVQGDGAAIYYLLYPIIIRPTYFLYRFIHKQPYDGVIVGVGDGVKVGVGVIKLLQIE